MSTSSSPRTALVIEDNEPLAHLLRVILEREDFTVETVQDGRRALGRIAAGAPVALVLLDLMLPYVDGLQIIGHIRAQEGWEAVPIIMVTGKSLEDSIVRALDAGAQDYIVKPFQPNELRARIRRVLKTR